MVDYKKFLDQEGVKLLWSRLSMEDYPNNETLMAVINAIDETKADRSELFSGSWNDLTDKPFEDKTIYVDVLPETALNCFDIINIEHLVVGNTYVVVYDGIEYECVCKGTEGQEMLGNAAWGGGEATNEPFFFNNTISTVIFDDGGTHTITIKEFDHIETIQIDEKYIPVIDILQAVYPVGSIYIAASSVSPSTLFGFGTWEQIKDTFLLSAGDTYTAGSTGGEAKHVLTVAETPSLTGAISIHGKYIGTPISGASGVFSAATTVSNKYLSGTSSSGSNSLEKINFSNGGQGKGHNNMPPYLTVYMWKRIA